MGKLGKDAIRRALRKAHENQEEERIPADKQTVAPEGSFNILVFFNIEAVDGEGHAILGLGPVGGPIMTYSYYREGTALKAPARMACLRKAETFDAIIDASGWIIHGDHGDWWNEHVNAALAMYCTKEQYDPILAYAEEKTKNPGTYDFVTHNCLDFVEDALMHGGVELVTHSGNALHNIAPRDAFQDARAVTGAKPFGQWKYWFPITPAPQNGLRIIPDEV